MRKMPSLGALVIALIFTGLSRHAPAEAQAIRWDRVIGAIVAQMDDAQRGRAAALLRSEFCYAGCSRAIARCLEAERPSRTAQRLAGYVVRQILAGRTDTEIREGIRNRALSAHPTELATIDLSSAQCLGPAGAPVTIVEYADFECPFCRVVSPILHRLVEQTTPSVRLCFKHFPVRGHSHAVPTSIASLAAAQQGRFWQIHDQLYRSAPRLDEEHIVACARGAGVPDMDRWQRDRGDAQFRALIETDKLEGLRNGVAGTPTLFINAKQYLGRNDEAELRDRIEEELDIVAGRL